ncbi:hypothetical protein CcCBS67573_g05814 [Chytriomyces confervae]|uniref:Bromo domain-containing protein n=1 Tax=Chytriomyces confervae TaxID=246404 RepID=A0A507F8Q0_9FUNG|nr:hypothetical protein CcCBS67573_g05814 [Chytriomyces confervae]
MKRTLDGEEVLSPVVAGENVSESVTLGSPVSAEFISNIKSGHDSAAADDKSAYLHDHEGHLSKKTKFVPETSTLESIESLESPDRPTSNEQLIEPSMPLPIPVHSTPVHVHSPPDSLIESSHESVSPQPTASSASATAPHSSVNHHATHTPTQLDLAQLKYCNQIIGKVRRLKDAPPFLAPVDPIRLGIPTYFDVVKRPMDLSTIQKKMEAHQYKSAHGFIDDCTLMFDNCYLFNGRESLIGAMAQRLQGYIQQQLLKMPTSIEKKRPNPQQAPIHHGLAQAERPKRDVQPPPRVGLESSSPNRKPMSRQAVSDLRHAVITTRELFKAKYYAFSFPFLEPVDHVKLQIPTYPHIIRNPMDFGTIQKKLDSQAYANGAEFEADARLVFRNCYTFNADGSEVNRMGRQLEQVFELKWRERPFLPVDKNVPVKRGSFSGSAMGGSAGAADSDSGSSSSSEEEGKEFGKVQENLLKLMEEVTKLAAHKGNKDKKKHKKAKLHAMQQQLLAAQSALPPSASAAVASYHSSITASKKKKKSSSSAARRSGVHGAQPVVKEITYNQKKELSEKIEMLAPEKLERVFEIIRSGMPNIDTAAEGQDEIELDIDALDKVTLSKLYHFVVNAAAAASATSSKSGGNHSRPAASAGPGGHLQGPPKSMTQAVSQDSSDSGSSSGSDSDSGSNSNSKASSGSENERLFTENASVAPPPAVAATDFVKPETVAPMKVKPEPNAPSTTVAPTTARTSMSQAKSTAGPVAPPRTAPVKKPVSNPNAAAGGPLASSLKNAVNPSTTGDERSAGGPLGVKRSELKFKKATVPSAAFKVKAAAGQSSAGAVDPIDFLGYIDDVKRKQEAEAAEHQRKQRVLSMQELANQERIKAREARDYAMRRNESGVSGNGIGSRSLGHVVPDVYPSMEERAAKYAQSVQKYEGKWIDLQRQGSVMIAFDDELRREMNPRMEAALSRERSDLLNALSI